MPREFDRTSITPGPLSNVQQVLARFAATPARIDRDRLMFLAGRASAKPTGVSAQCSAAQKSNTEVDGKDHGLTSIAEQSLRSTQFPVLSPQNAPPRGPFTGRAMLHPPARQAAWLWPTTTAVFAATSLALLVMLLAHEPAIPAARPVAAPTIAVVAPPAPPSAEPLMPVVAESGALPVKLAVRPQAWPAANYLRTRDVALRIGVDGLGLPREGEAEADGPADYGAWRRALQDTAEAGRRLSVENSSL